MLQSSSFFGRRVDFLVPSGAPWPCESSAVLGLRRSALVRPLDPKNKAVFPIRSRNPSRTRSAPAPLTPPPATPPDSARLRPPSPTRRRPVVRLLQPSKVLFFSRTFSNLLELSTPRPARSGPVSRHNSPRPTSLHRLRHLSEQYFPPFFAPPFCAQFPTFCPLTLLHPTPNYGDSNASFTLSKCPLCAELSQNPLFWLVF